ncbi:hypothetical protein CTA2_10536 [Colletotrichum tanaceti]|uniref:Uncharacterized protein n=1 Tax=Colletotrichum tanaceti TaxID=1306861 RepID=A0A4U6XSA0_9PEZI|nr:hypothetical protein CTA2_10536 [Colletotrichum tanaceti]TKW58770.1 hypothetical protein CTA1_4460 [Colletotrichum tanaceti]
MAPPQPPFRSLSELSADPRPSELPADLPPLPLPPLTTTIPPSAAPSAATSTSMTGYPSIVTEKTLRASRDSGHDVRANSANPSEPPPYSSPSNDSQASTSGDSRSLPGTASRTPSGDFQASTSGDSRGLPGTASRTPSGDFQASTSGDSCGLPGTASRTPSGDFQASTSGDSRGLPGTASRTPSGDFRASTSGDSRGLPGTASGPPSYTGLPRLDYKLYSPPLFTLSPDCTTLSSRAEHLTASASALVSFVRMQASVPPKPLIHVRGNRGRTVDFDFKMNLMSLVVPDDMSRRMDYIRCVAPGELAFRGGAKPDVLPEVGDRELEEWCRRFIEDPAPVKSFALGRVVANMDALYIEGQIRSLIASTQYKGQINISFPVTHANVKIKSAEKPSKLYLGMKNLFSSKHKYEVVQSVWPFASARNGEDGRRCMVQSEEVWWREWRDSIKYAVAQKRQNGAYVTNEDKLEALMEGKGKGVTAIDWGRSDFDEQGV